MTGDGKSLMNMTNNIGLSTISLGIPLVTGTLVDSLPFITTFWDLSVR